MLFSTSPVVKLDIKYMRTGDIRKELKSYGISTKSLLERQDLVDALEKARAEEKQQSMLNKIARPPVSVIRTRISDIEKELKSDRISTESRKKKKKRLATMENALAIKEQQSMMKRPPVATDRTLPRDERIALEIKNCNRMHSSLIKEELEERGIDPKGFFEKSEMVRTLAESRVDGITTSSTGVDEVEHENAEAVTDETASDPGGNEEKYSVAVNAFRKRRSDSMEDAGNHPFADQKFIRKAEELFANPEVQELLRKAYEDQKVMEKFTECMGNPKAMMKYANDPDIKVFVDELRKYM
jgi:hypothetical protein